MSMRMRARSFVVRDARPQINVVRRARPENACPCSLFHVPNNFAY